MIDGKKIKLGGAEYTVAPLTFRQLRTLQPQLDKLTTLNAVPSREQMDAVLDIVHAALLRNHPDVTRDGVEDLVDLGNLSAVVQAVMGVSGLESGEGATSGEAGAGSR
jgi:hypothetical protein